MQRRARMVINDRNACFTTRSAFIHNGGKLIRS